jgi:hypothetical protein
VELANRYFTSTITPGAVSLAVPDTVTTARFVCALFDGLLIATVGAVKSVFVITTRLATELVTEPALLLTTTQYPSASLCATLASVNVAVFAPEIFPPSDKSTPPFFH